jgi:hypothetical protein
MRVLDSSDDSIMACGGIYTTRTDPPEPIVYMARGQGAYWNWKMGDIFPCWGLGNGCLMVRTKIFGMMSKPWYRDIRTIEDLRQYPELFPEAQTHNGRVSISPDIFFFTKLEQMGFKCMAHGGVLPIHWDVEKNQAYWLPADTPPTKNVLFDGKPFGWTSERLVACP